MGTEQNPIPEEQSGIDRRRQTRHSIPAAVTCTFFKGDLKGKNSFRGFIQNISLGGASLEIRDDSFLINDSFLQFTNMEMVFELPMPEGTHRITISGIIRWYHKIKKKDVNLLCLGVQFYNVDDRAKDILNQYLTQGAGDKNLIWSLWDTLNPHT
jgi:c-di-GMP-binding flagellar brake protein YcgR